MAAEVAISPGERGEGRDAAIGHDQGGPGGRVRLAPKTPMMGAGLAVCISVLIPHFCLFYVIAIFVLV